MVVRKKNLLDAFREAAPEGKRASEPSRQSAPGSSSSPSSVGGPFASQPSNPPPGPSSRPPARPPEDSPEIDFESTRIPSTLELAFADRTLRAVVGIVALIVLGAFVVGRMNADPTEAADGSARADDRSSGPGVIERAGASSTSAGGDLVQRNVASAKMGTEDDRAFMDPANKVTIRLIQYDNTETNLELARTTAEHLRRREGLPVVGPISMGKILVLAAGHAPRIDDLQGLLKHVKTLPGPPPQEKRQPFADAYIVNIDDVVKRD
jgi:hypothetical protein